jgi:hypothetical protein
MEALGWIGSERPKMVAVQLSGCTHIVKAWMKEDALILAGCRDFGRYASLAYGDYLILDILKRSGGIAVAAPTRNGSISPLGESGRALRHRRRCFTGAYRTLWAVVSFRDKSCSYRSGLKSFEEKGGGRQHGKSAGSSDRIE